MMILAEEGRKHGKWFNRSAVVKGNPKAALQAEFERLEEEGLQYAPLDEGGMLFRVTGDGTDYRMCAYVTEPLVVEPFVISVFYHLREAYYVEVLRDTPNNKVVVYLYSGGVPGLKDEIARMEMTAETADDDEVIAGLILRIEDKVRKIEGRKKKK